MATLLAGYFFLFRSTVDKAPRRLLVFLSCIPSATLGEVVFSHINVSLPLAPVIARDALGFVNRALSAFLLIVAWPLVIYGNAAAFCRLGLCRRRRACRVTRRLALALALLQSP